MIARPPLPEPPPNPHPGPGGPPGSGHTGGYHPPPSNSSGGVTWLGPDTMNGTEQSAFDQMAILLEQMGLSSLLEFLKGLILRGVTDSASLQLELQARPEWKARFAGNEALKAKGLGVLSPGEYLQMEKSYGQIMKMYGLPEGFYDEPSDYAKWIGGNVSVNELQQRVASYADLANREDPETVKQMTSMGLTRGDLLAYMMDPDRALPTIQKLYQTTLLGGAARRAGYTPPSNEALSRYAANGVTEQQASQGFGLIAGSLADAQTLGGVYGEDYTTQDMEQEVFENNATAGKKRRRLASAERAAFGGSAGQSGLTRNTGGSY